MELEHEIAKYISESLNNSPSNAIRFLINAWSSTSLNSNEKYEAILNYFIKEIFNKKIPAIEEPTKELLKLKFPQNSVSNDTVKKILKIIKQTVKNGKSLDSIEIATTVILNESYKEFFKLNLSTYCKLIRSSLDAFNTVKCHKFEILDDIIIELYYFSKSPSFSENFLEFILIPLHKAAVNCQTFERSNDMWNLIKSIFFSRSINQENSSESHFVLFDDEKLTLDQLEVLIESFIIAFRSELTEIIELLNHYNENVLSKHENNKSVYLNHIKMIYNLLKIHEIEISAVKNSESFEDFSQQIISGVESSINEMDLCEYFRVLTAIISYDPFLIAENNLIYKLLVECMLKEKNELDMADYKDLLAAILKIFGRDINQFVKKLLAAMNEKLENFEIPKGRKRKSANDSIASKKKLKLADGSSAVAETLKISKIFPHAIQAMMDEIFADINVSQTVKLWKILNNSLSKSLQSTIDENCCFKIDFVSSLLCQLIRSTRIHEHVIYKSSEISTAINDFNGILKEFYELISSIEYNERITTIFLKMSFDYENFMMLYYYHYEENDKKDLDRIFIDNEPSEWKSIQKKIEKFGKSQEKAEFNILMIQKLLKSKLFGISSQNDVQKFLKNLILDNEQIDLLLGQKDTRLHFINFLNDEDTAGNIIGDIFSSIDDETGLKLAKLNPKMLNSFINLLINNGKNQAVIDVVRQLPMTLLSHETKSKIIEKLISAKKLDLLVILNKFFANDGYMAFSKDLPISKLFEQLNDFDKYKAVYEAIIKTCLKKMTTNVLIKNLDWIVSEKKSSDLIEILAKGMSEINVMPTNQSSSEQLNKFKLDVIKYLSTKLNEKNILVEQQTFCVFSRLCSQNMPIISDEIKEHHLELLNKLVKSLSESIPSDGTIKVFMSTLKDAKKLNLNDEIKGGIVKTSTKYMHAIIKDTLNSKEEVDSKRDVDKERELIAILSTFRSSCREECSKFLHQLINNMDSVNNRQLVYSFKLYEILFQSCEKNDRKDSMTLIKNYMSHCDNHVMESKEIMDVDLLCAIYASNIAMMKCYKDKLDFFIVDHLFAFHIEHQQPCLNDIEGFCKFYEIVGQFLFVLANFTQDYFKSRIPQYFKAYNKFLDAIYYYKADSKDELDAKESSMLLRLTLQLENIMKMLMKLHSKKFTIIAPYIISSIANVFIRTPKMFKVGDKFKVNIKNICYQLLSTFDDKTRKHIYAMVDESTRDVYDGLFKELRKK